MWLGGGGQALAMAEIDERGDLGPWLVAGNFESVK